MSWDEAINSVRVDELIRLAGLDKKDPIIDLFDRYDAYVKRQKDPRLRAGFVHQVRLCLFFKSLFVYRKMLHQIKVVEWRSVGSTTLIISMAS